MRERSLLVGSLTVAAAAFGFAILGPLARVAYEAGLEPFSFVAWRAGFGTVVVATWTAWLVARRARRFVAPWRLPRRQAAMLALASVAAIGVNVASFVAFGRTTVALVLLGFYTYPAFVAAVAAARGDEPLDSIRATALVISLAGMVLVVAGGLGSSGTVHADALGIGLALVAALSQTVYVSVSRHGYSAVPTEQAVAWILGSTMAVAIVIALASGSAAQLLLPLRSGDALVFAALAGIVGAGVPSLLFLTGIRTIGGTRTGILMLLEPVVGVLLAAALLDERVQPVQLLGGVAILGAAVLLQRSPAPSGIVVATGPGAATGAER